MDKLLPILKIVDVEITKLKHEIDMINAKLKSKFFKKKPEDLEEAIEPETEKIISGDGFDDIRQLRKSGVV